MAKVMIRCPVKGTPVYTGMDFDEQSFKSVELTGNSVKCSACGQMHTWSKSDAFLA